MQNISHTRLLRPNTPPPLANHFLLEMHTKTIIRRYTKNNNDDNSILNHFALFAQPTVEPAARTHLAKSQILSTFIFQIQPTPHITLFACVFGRAATKCCVGGRKGGEGVTNQTFPETNSESAKHKINTLCALTTLVCA